MGGIRGCKKIKKVVIFRDGGWRVGEKKIDCRKSRSTQKLRRAPQGEKTVRTPTLTQEKITTGKPNLMGKDPNHLQKTRRLTPGANHPEGSTISGS